jgi:lysophospholipase L1-like esterase
LNASRHDTGITIALTVALATGLSLAPLPDDWRPLPELRENPLPALAGIVLPKAEAGRPTDAITGAPALAPEEPKDAPVEPEIPVPPEPPPTFAAPLSPAAALGAAEARSVRALEKLVAEVGAAHVDIEQPCLEEAAEGCARQALDRFFDDIESLRGGARRKPVRVVHLGDSLIASDHITDVIRRRLEVRHGSGGRGFLFVDRPTRYSGRKVRTGEASPGWEIVKLTDKTDRGVLGFSGVRFASAGASETTRFDVPGTRYADLFFLTQPSGGLLEVRADSKQVTRILTRFSRPEVAFAKVKIPPGSGSITLSTSKGPVALFGAALENGLPGVVYDSIGIPGGSAEVFLRAGDRAFASQLSHRDPSLVVVMLGGNEAYEMGRGWMTLEGARSTLDKLVERVRASVPKASCLLTAPLDAGVRTVDGSIVPRKYTAEVAAAVREVAMARGCAYWDMLSAMGGIGSAPRWLERGLIHTDLAHPRALGSDVIGHLFDFALERARMARPSASLLPAADPPGLEIAQGALDRVFARLRSLEQGASEPVSIVQIGASHTAAHMFTDEARAQLAAVFGDAGRGFIAAGKASKRLKRGGVRRELHGFWTVADARERPPGEPWGLTGIRAEGMPGAKLSVSFGVGQAAGSAPGVLGLYYLERPAMGTLEVRIDGEVVGRMPEVAPAKIAARVATWPVRGRGHTLEVVNVGAGPITLFGAALDLKQPGIRYDALGLPGSTSMLADGFDKRVLAHQLRARDADLYVLFYGTNESAIPRLDPERLRRHYSSLLATLRRASPESDCLLIGPTDRLKKENGRWVEAPSINTVIRVIRELARDEGCAFWSARAAMGGPRSIARWQQLDPPLGNEDGVHLTRRGYETLAQAFTDDLLGAYRRWLGGKREEAPAPRSPDHGVEETVDGRGAREAAEAPAEAQVRERQVAGATNVPDAGQPEEVAAGEADAREAGEVAAGEADAGGPGGQQASPQASGEGGR